MTLFHQNWDVLAKKLFKKIWIDAKSDLVVGFGSIWCPNSKTNPKCNQINFFNWIILTSANDNEWLSWEPTFDFLHGQTELLPFILEMLFIFCHVYFAAKIQKIQFNCLNLTAKISCYKFFWINTCLNQGPIL